MARAAAATALLSHELNKLSGQSVSRSTQTISRDTDQLAKSANQADGSINRLTGRLALFADAALTLGPALIPIGAVALPAVTGLADALGVTALAAATTIASFQGVGAALKAVDAAALDPTTQNLQKMHQALDNLSPAAQDLVKKLHDLEPALHELRDTGAQALFPGIETSIDELLTRLPEVRRIISAVATGISDTLTQGAADLASSRWDDFFSFLAEEAPGTLTSLGQILSGIAHGMAELWMAFQPLNNSFIGWLVDVAAGFDRWATGLSQTKGFADFLAYVRDTGPQVLATTESLANALLQIVEAAAPLGGPILHGLEDLFNVISSIADSDLGTPILLAVGALRLLSRTTQAYGRIQETTWGARAIGNVRGMADAIMTVTTAEDRARLSAVQLARVEEERAAVTRRGIATIGKGAAAIGALALVASGAADNIGLTNTASLGLIGTIGGPWGAALGAAAGATLDLVHSNDELDAAVSRVNGTIRSGSLQAMEQLRAQLQASLDVFNRQTDDKGGFTGFIDSLVHLPGNAFSVFSGSVDRTAASINILDAAIQAAKRGSVGLPEVLGGDLLRNVGFLGRGFLTAAQSADQFTQQMTRANNILTMRGSLRSYQQALDDFDAAVKKNGKSMDIQTSKGREVQAALDNIASTAIQAATNLSGLRRTRYLDQARKDFIGAAMDLGKTRDQAEKLADRLGLLDQMKSKPTVKLQGMVELNRNLDELNAHFAVIDGLSGGPTVGVDGVAAAMGDLAALQARIDSLHGNIVQNTILEKHVNVQAAGGVLDFYGRGGIRESHVAQIAPAGAMRVWAEPETQGEAYIPFADDWRRHRAQDVWREAGRRIGMAWQEYAIGGINGRALPSSAPATRIVERVIIERFADRVTLVDKNGALAEFTVQTARGQIADDRSYHATLARQGVS